MLLANPEVLLWERFWLERNKDLDRELYGIVKWCNPDLEFGLNVWNRNHFNPLRKAQWPWAEQTRYADWVKPITYQHQSGQVYINEMGDLHKSILRDFTPQELTPLMYKLLGLHEAPWDELMAAGMDPDTYVYGQCADAVRGVAGKVRSTWASAWMRRASHAQPGALHAGHCLPQRAGHLSRRRQGRDLCAQLCQHEPDQPGWRRARWPNWG